MKYNILIFLMVIVTSSCSHTSSFIKGNSTKVPKDFYFNIDLENGDYYNGKDNLYYRQYSSDLKSVKLKLSRKEISEIYKLIKVYDFAAFPKIYEATIDEKAIESGLNIKKIFITVHALGNLKTVLYNSGYITEKKKLDAKLFIELHSKISKIIHKKIGDLNLPETDYYYE